MALVLQIFIGLFIVLVTNCTLGRLWSGRSAYAANFEIAVAIGYFFPIIFFTLIAGGFVACWIMFFIAIRTGDI